MALWAQFNLIDGGETLGKYISLFREAYFSMKNNFWGGVDFKFKPNLQENLNRKIGQKSLRYAEWEANDLPEKVVIDMPIELSQEASEWYQSIINGIIYAEGDIELIKESFHKLRRLCSGYFVFKNAEGVEREITVKENNKLETLIELIESSPEDSKLVIFLDYVSSGDKVCEELRKRKIKFERLYGGTKDKIATKNRFIDDPSVKVFVTNTKSGGVGLNLQVANYAIFYELPLSNIDYMQALKRVHRTGQEKRTFIYHLTTKNSIEEKLMKYIVEGQDLFKALIEGREKWI
jgi:SNF2 family DNA or RNA helicase